MLYHNGNAMGATVHDLDTRQRIDRVISVDTEANEIEVPLQPHQFTEDGKRLATMRLKYTALWPIFGWRKPGKEPWEVGYPCMFHCYGRLN